MSALISFAVGLLFGLGLIISGMSDPVKVLAFLDPAGNWDPSLLVVMASALAVGIPAFRLAGRRQTSWRDKVMQIPSARQIDRRLVVGSALFGVGWGLAGICPGPGLVLFGAGAAKGLVFVLALLAGMSLFAGFDRLQSRRRNRFSQRPGENDVRRTS